VAGAIAITNQSIPDTAILKFISNPLLFAELCGQGIQFSERNLVFKGRRRLHSQGAWAAKDVPWISTPNLPGASFVKHSIAL
jgi:hypothetical protein